MKYAMTHKNMNSDQKRERHGDRKKMRMKDKTLDEGQPGLPGRTEIIDPISDLTTFTCSWKIDVIFGFIASNYPPDSPNAAMLQMYLRFFSFFLPLQWSFLFVSHRQFEKSLSVFENHKT